MYKYLFFLFFIFLTWSCSSPEKINPNECSNSNPCETGYTCENGSCNLDKPNNSKCTPGEVKNCYTGGKATRNVGTCKDGFVTCDKNGNWEMVCKGVIKPVNEICGDGLDNNCSGKADENCGCSEVGETRSCYTGATETNNKGICKSGVETCLDSYSWSGICSNEVLPVQDSCENKDNDCNGLLDKSESRCEVATDCTPGEKRNCNTAGNNIGVGVCKAGYNLCNELGSWNTECKGEIFAQDNEVCNDGIDNNCDGKIDENCDCTPGEEKTCYTGSPEELGKGICESGVITCDSNGKWNIECIGEEKPITEICDGKDNDCDGVVDNGVSNACGECGALPVEVCNNKDDDCDGIIDNVLPENGGNACGKCGDVPTEVCGNGLDDDCDGIPDSSEEVCNTIPECIKTSDKDICDNGLDDDCDNIIDNCDTFRNCTGSNECFSGSPDSVMSDGSNKSICQKGTMTCVGGESWGACVNEILPQMETCNGKDDDCDGVIDNGFNIGQSCFVGIGECKKAGVYSCNNQGGVTCIDTSGMPLVAGEPQNEICDNLDNNCNGAIDEIFSLNQNCYNGKGICEVRGKTVCSSDHLNTVCDSVKGTPQTEICGDGLDNDCNGRIDDVQDIGLSCESGVGACKATGVKECDDLNHVVICNAVPSQPQTEVCGDGIDNNCNGTIDTDTPSLGNSCTNGVGICMSSGSKVCLNQQVVCGAIPGDALDQEICNNGLDDNCNGEENEAGCVSFLSAVCPSNYPNAVPSNDAFGRAYTLETYPFTATVGGDNGNARYKWELIDSPSGNPALNQEGTANSYKTVNFSPQTISATASGAYKPYKLKFTVTEGGNTASCISQFYAIPKDNIHVELTKWDNLTDMDLHVLAPGGTNWVVTGNSGDLDCGYKNCTDGLNWNGGNLDDTDLYLDVDNMKGFGTTCSGDSCNKPENINVPVPRNRNEIYRVGVYGYRGNGTGLMIKISCLKENGLDVLVKEYGPFNLSEEDWWYAPKSIKWHSEGYCTIE